MRQGFPRRRRFPLVRTDSPRTKRPAAWIVHAAGPEPVPCTGENDEGGEKVSRPTQNHPKLPSDAPKKKYLLASTVVIGAGVKTGGGGVNGEGGGVKVEGG